tara:strand:- start:156 stop:278 length:123 start_codon:yes stop_codon:yes gene_type:complete
MQVVVGVEQFTSFILGQVGQEVVAILVQALIQMERMGQMG